MKKTLLLSILCLSSVAMTAWSQNLNQEDPEDVINVVGYFCKNDTMTYRQMHYKNKIQGNDTIVSENYREEFMIVVTDSTSEGYKMKYIPQSFTLRDTTIPDTGTATSQMSINAIALRQLMQSVVCEFTTDEKGLLKSITNWREISDQLEKGVKATCDNLYATLPDLDTTMLRQQLGVILALHFTTEKGIRNSYMELEDLFGLYGSTYEILPELRDGSKAICLLAVDDVDEEEKERLSILVDSNDGFKIAEKDMKLRGPGDLTGIRQSGIPSFSFLNIIDDFRIFEVARDDAKAIVKNKDNKSYMWVINKAKKEIDGTPLIKG